MLNANFYSHLSVPSSTHLKNCRPVLSCQENTSGNVTELPPRPKKSNSNRTLVADQPIYDTCCSGTDSFPNLPMIIAGLNTGSRRVPYCIPRVPSCLCLVTCCLSLAITEAGGQAFCKSLQHQQTCNRAPAKHRTTGAEATLGNTKILL